MSRRMRFGLASFVALLVLALPVWWGYLQVRAWKSLRAAQDALEADDSKAAKGHLAICQDIWPTSGEVRFLAARAARRCGDWADAMRLLDEAAERKWPEEAIDLERALLRAQAGEFDQVKGYLAECLKQEHPDEALILEVIVPIFFNKYQLQYVSVFLHRWRALKPNSYQPCRYQGKLAEITFNKTGAAEAYAEGLRLAPDNREMKEALAKMLLDLNKASEALPLLESLERDDPAQPEVRMLLALAYHSVGRRDEARELSVWLIRVAPESPDTLHLRGRLELEADRPEKAIAFLERAVQKEPFDKAILYTYLRCLSRLKRESEIPAIEKRLKQIDFDRNRMSQTVRVVAAKPSDPDPRAECGVILLRNGFETEGIRWLQSALELRLDHPATNNALADYFDKRGEPDKAERHRRLAERGAKKDREQSRDKK